MTSLMRGQLLGKHFRLQGKMPIGINVFNEDFKQRLVSLCSSTFGRMAGTGPLFSMQFTTVKQSIEHGIENLREICKTIDSDFPGGWSNVHHALLYGNNSQSLPIYYSAQEKNDTKKLNLPLNDQQAMTQIGELSTLDKNLNVIVEPNGAVHLTKRTKLSQGFEKKKTKKKSTKRLQATWTRGLRVQRTGSGKSAQDKKNKNKKDETPLVFDTKGKPLVDTAFVKRIADTKLVAKSEKPKHLEEDFARKPAPRAEKRKRLLAAAKQAAGGKDGGATALVADDEERKAKSGGRSKKKVSMNV